MLTVIFGLEASGNSSTCRPLGSAYSVMPSTLVTWVTPCGRPWARATRAHASTTIAARRLLLRVMRGYLRERLNSSISGRVETPSVRGIGLGSVPPAVMRGAQDGAPGDGSKIPADHVGRIVHTKIDARKSDQQYKESGGDPRSEERRVGKEGRSRWSPYH